MPLQRGNELVRRCNNGRRSPTHGVSQVCLSVLIEPKVKVELLSFVVSGAFKEKADGNDCES